MKSKTRLLAAAQPLVTWVRGWLPLAALRLLGSSAIRGFQNFVRRGNGRSVFFIQSPCASLGARASLFLFGVNLQRPSDADISRLRISVVWIKKKNLLAVRKALERFVSRSSVPILSAITHWELIPTLAGTCSASCCDPIWYWYLIPCLSKSSVHRSSTQHAGA